jgi:spore coat polysaccharide biosynthesis protein SpsF
MNEKRNEQEDFWAGEFGKEYIDRNKNEKLLASNFVFFSNIFSKMNRLPNTCIELGANIGMNIFPIKTLLPTAEVTGVEINKEACVELEKTGCKVINSSILELQEKQTYELVLLKGVLIHQNPDFLLDTYQKIFSLSSRWIVIAEYFNPTPIGISYRGHENKLFKRDFAGEMLNQFENLELIASGFNYHGDVFPQDDINWFLMEKKGK